MIENEQDLPGKDVKFNVEGNELHIIFNSEIDAIEMMPKGPSIFERRKNVIVMMPRPKSAGKLWVPHPDA